MIPPPLAARRAFGAEGEPELLSGTSGGVWRIGALVLKRVDDPVEHDFVASLSAQLAMVASSVLTDEGHWRHDGWTATRWVDAGPDPARWDEVLEAGQQLHAALAALDPPWPSALDARTSPWAVADRVAWRAQSLPDLTGLANDVATRALTQTSDAPEPVQVIHGDLAGNVLFRSDGPPVVVDLSLYRRPVTYAAAIAVLDQICWHGAPEPRASLVTRHALARAVVFRVVAAALQSPESGVAEAQRAVHLLE